MRAPAEPNATEALTASSADRPPTPLPLTTSRGRLPYIYFDIFYDSLFGGFGFPATQMKLTARYLLTSIFLCCAPSPLLLSLGENVNNQAQGKGNFMVDMDGFTAERALDLFSE